MLRALCIHSGFARNIRHIPVCLDPQQAAHIPIRIFALVMRLGSKTVMILFQKITQTLCRSFDFFKRDAPAGAFGYCFGSCVIPLFMPHFRLFGDLT